jgi:aurora kinase
MASVSAVTRQIAALEIAGKKQPASKSKQPSQNVSKLLTKFAAPNPFPNSKPTQPSSLRNQTCKQTTLATQTVMDIGRYDGGFEIDNEKRGEKVFGEAAEDLALDSSVSQFVFASILWNSIAQPGAIGNAQRANGN